MKISNVFAIVSKDTKKIMRNKLSLFSLLLPILIFLFMAFTISSRKISIDIIVVNQDPDSEAFVEELKKVPIFEMEMLEDWKKAQSRVREGKAFVALKIPSGFAENIRSQKESELELVYDEKNMDRLVPVLSLIKEKAAGKSYVKTKLDGVHGATSLEILFSWIILYDIVWIGVSFAISAIIDEREHETMKALLTMPFDFAEIVLGKTIVPLILVFSTVTLALVTAYLFKVEIKGSLVYFFVLVVLITLFYQNIGVAISFFMKSTDQANMGSTLIFLLSIMPSLPLQKRAIFIALEKGYPPSLMRKMIEDVIIAGTNYHTSQLLLLLFFFFLSLLFAVWAVKHRPEG